MSVVRKISEHRNYKQQDAKPSLDKGFALFHRKVMDCGFYKDSQAVHLWFHLVMKATHKPIVSTTEFGDIRLERGQCITGRHKLASETGISPDRIQYLLRRFVSMDMISAESNRKFTVISIVKYDEYQADFLPTDYQQITSANPHGTSGSTVFVPTDSQQITTYNELLTNNSISKDIECATSDKKSVEQKQRISCEEIWQTMRECVPDARGWNALTPKRRTLIQKFWREVKPVARQFGDEAPFGMEQFRHYLNYIHASCRWMFETRADHQTGKTWQKKNYEYILSAEIYAQVREGERDDR